LEKATVDKVKVEQKRSAKKWNSFDEKSREDFLEGKIKFDIKERTEPGRKA